MFNLIRRISNGVILRPDRPWADDATSNAPTKGKKRRLERNADTEPEEIKTKKIKGESTPETATPQPESQAAPALKLERQEPEETDVKEVTKGVKEVELNESRPLSSSKEVKPESVPLPGEDDVEELEGGADASPPLEAGLDAGADGEEVDGPSEPDPKAQEKEGVEEEAEVPEKETKKAEAMPTQPAR